MEVRRLHPDAAAVDAAEAMADLRLHERAPADRPYVVANMVASADGRAVVEGGSSPLTSPADRVIFHALRGQVDAVLAGTGTLRAEGYRRLVRDQAKRDARAARGLEPDPLAVVLSRSGDLPDIEMLTDPEQPRAIFTGDEADPTDALRRLRTEHGVRALLCEGGPGLLGGLLRDGLVDELFLSLAPVIAGGDGAPIVQAPPLHPRVTLHLVHLIEHEDVLFLRYAVGQAGG